MHFGSCLFYVSGNDRQQFRSPPILSNRFLVVVTAATFGKALLARIDGNRAWPIDLCAEVSKKYCAALQAAGIRTLLDDDNTYSPGWKFNNWETQLCQHRLRAFFCLILLDAFVCFPTSK